MYREALFEQGTYYNTELVAGSIGVLLSGSWKMIGDELKT